MTARTAVQATNAGATITEVTGASSGDTIPDSTLLLIRNTGAGTHNVDIGVNATFDGFAPFGPSSGLRRYTLTTGQVMLVKIPDTYGDANGLCSVTIDGTASEVKYSVIGV